MIKCGDSLTRTNGIKDFYDAIILTTYRWVLQLLLLSIYLITNFSALFCLLSYTVNLKHNYFTNRITVTIRLYNYNIHNELIIDTIRSIMAYGKPSGTYIWFSFVTDSAFKFHPKHTRTYNATLEAFKDSSTELNVEF